MMPDPIMHERITCDNRLQDGWAECFLAMARTLNDRFGIEGRAVVREGVRRYAAVLGTRRRAELLETGNKANLESVFSCGFGLACGEHSRKEWIRCTEQEFFFNVLSCPYSDFWMARDATDLGIMFCEEYYPALVHAATSEKAQINLGHTMINGRENFCRLSFYLRPTNLDPAQRAECFPEHDLSGKEPGPLPSYSPDYAELKKLLYETFRQAARDLQGEAAVAALEEVLRA